MDNYQHLMQDIMNNGEDRGDRTGVGTRSIFGTRLVFDMADGFPAVTTKKLAFKSVMGELLWFMKGCTDLKSLRELTFGRQNAEGKKTIWDANQLDYVMRRNQAMVEGVGEDCGKIYGHLWNKNNQFWEAVNDIVHNPESRRIMVNAWIPEIVNDNLQVALPPCHYGFQFYVHTNGKLDIMWNQRSVDVFLGLPFNIASYAALLHIVCEMTGKTPGRVIFNGGDTHIYHNHFDAVMEQLSRRPKPKPMFHIKTNHLKDAVAEDHHASSFHMIGIIANDFELIGYDHHPAIKAEMAV